MKNHTHSFSQPALQVVHITSASFPVTGTRLQGTDLTAKGLEMSFSGEPLGGLGSMYYSASTTCYFVHGTAWGSLAHFSKYSN